MSRYLPPTVLACVLACFGADVRAEVSLGIVSDYRYRGVSLSDGDPALQAGAVLNRDDGWYAGLFAASTRIGDARGLHLVSYAGRAWRLDSGRSWEAGLQYVALTSPDEDHGELYLGLVSDRWNARLYYQPEPFGDGAAAYVEVNARYPLGERWSLLGHVGAAWRGDPGPYADGTYYDGRFGVGVSLGAFDLHLQRVLTARSGGYLAYGLDADAGDAGWVLGATWTW